jgi:hypothetical protein
VSPLKLKKPLVSEAVDQDELHHHQDFHAFLSCRDAGLAMSDDTIKLSETDAGTLRAIDAMRDDEQHWFNEVSEQILYLHVRTGVTLFDDILQRVFGERLNMLFPERVLLVSADPPHDLALLLDDEYTQIKELLRPGRRARHEARARIRTLLAMEAHVEPETRVSSKDVDRVEEGIRNGDPRVKVLPRLSTKKFLSVPLAASGTELRLSAAHRV